MQRLLVLLFLASVASAGACSECRPAVRAGVYDREFPRTLLTLSLPLLLIGGVAYGLHRLDGRGR